MDDSTDFRERIAATRPLDDPMERARLRARIGARMLGEDVPPPTLGRYVVVGRLGAGAMGVVYGGYDPKLDRKVALKVIDEAMQAQPERRTRLLREAQSLAHLSHPNIVGIHDVGTLGERIWIAMEFIDGETLGAWMRTPRRWPEVWAVLVGVGRGLAAAHASGLVHRDVKPDNIMVGSDGRARVTDFGLAGVVRSSDRTAGSRRKATGRVPRVDALRAALTMDGAAPGTPGFVAPEVLAGHAATPASDQYGYCVTAWEALFRERPPAGSTTGVPGWLRRVIARGLAEDPSDRWPSMDALIDAVVHGHRRSRWRAWRHATIAVASVLVLGAAAVRLDVVRRTAACERAGRTIAEVWNDEARRRVRSGLVATDLTYASATADRAMPWLDRYAAAWQAAAEQTCLDGSVRGTWGDRVVDQSSWCLEERRAALAEFIGELATADARTVDLAVSDAAQLPPIEECRDEDHLARFPPPPVAIRDMVRAGWDEIGRIHDLERAERYDESLAAARSLRAEVARLDWPPLTLATWSLEADLLQASGALEDAVEVESSAYFEAARLGAWDSAAKSAINLIHLHALLMHHEEGLAWNRHAEVAIVNAGSADGLRDAWRLNALAGIHRSRGDDEEALALFERALELRETMLAPDNLRLASSLSNLGVMHSDLGHFDRATRLLERALAIRVEHLGPAHPDVANVLNNLGILHRRTGDLTAALEAHRRALQIREAALAHDRFEVAESLTNLGVVEWKLGDLASAEPRFRRASEMYRAAVGSSHPWYAVAVENLAGVLGDRSEYDQALSLQEEVLQIQQERLGPGHPAVARALVNISLTMASMGQDPARVEERQRDALHIRETALGSEHPEVAQTLTLLGKTLLGQNRDAEALVRLKRAVAIYDAHVGTQSEEIEARFALAQALARR